MRSLCVLSALLAATGLQAAPYLYDVGTADSQVWPGFARATTESAWSPQAGFGWQSTEGLKGLFRRYEGMVENRSRGIMELPPLWTNPLTEDAILGDRENAFLIQVPPGDYGVYVVCGTSESFRSQYFDFTVQVGEQQQHVQIEGGQRFQSLRFQTRIVEGPLAVRFTPRNKWVVCAILAWPVAESARIEQEILSPFEEWTYRLPPEEWAKWQEDAHPAPDPLPPLSEADQRRGFLLYTRHYLECVFPNTRPRPEDLNPELRLFATPGEYEPTNFIVFPLKDLVGAKVTVSSLGPVPASAIEVRYVPFVRARLNYRTNYRYRVVPDYLLRFDTLNLKAEENARFWITVHVPEEAPPGEYRGTATFECSSGKAEVPIRLRVLPFRLREDPSKIYGIYYRHPYDQAFAAEDAVSREYFLRKAELEHQDMVAHGTRNVVLSVSTPAADEQGRFRFNFDVLAAKLDLWKRYGFRGPVIMGISTMAVYRKYMGEDPGSHLRNVKMPPEAFAKEMTAMVKAIEEERKKRGWPEFVYYPVDEPSRSPESVAFMEVVLKACKEAGVRTYVTADPRYEEFDPLRPYVDIWCTQPFAPDRETILADMAKRKVEYWCYPNHVNGENDHTPVAGARMTYGFGFWRSGFVTLIPWIYSYDVSDPFNYLDGATMDFFNRHEPDGTPIPVAMWEAYREGYDDYRYIYTLEQLIAEAKRSNRPKVRQAAEQAQKELDSVWNAIRVQEKYKYDDLWAPEEFDVYRWIVARQILALREAMGKP